jgi:alpha-L-rhamnosidase
MMMITGCGGTEDHVDVFDLQCENLTDPSGIGTKNPGLSWKIEFSESGTMQKAYQILGASRIDLLDEVKADLWNSGKISSSASVLVPYNGKELKSRSICYWKVRIWDENDVASAWSDIASFSVGLLEEDDWQSDYIGYHVVSEYNVSPQLRKTFDLNDTGETVFLYVNSLGYHEVYLNGSKVEDFVLSPAVSQFDKRSQVITYDLSRLARQGRNDLVIWIARGWYSSGLPGVAGNGPFVRAQAEILKEGQWETVLRTDPTWTGRNSGYATIGNWRSNQFGGEFVDAARLLPDLSPASLDSAGWDPVQTVKITAGEATPQVTEPNRIMDTIAALSVWPVKDSTWLVDMGTTITGYAEILFPSLRAGQVVTMEYSDHLHRNGEFADQDQSDRFVSAGGKNELFRNKFNYHGFRYIKISNLDQLPDEKNIRAQLIHTGFKSASTFECSDPDLNRIHDMINYTLRCLSLGGYLVDCPTVERLGYGGDGNASTETAQTMFELAPLYANWLQAWADCIREDGGMPHTAPNPYPAGGGPYWCGFIITASWRTYCNYGDIRMLEKYYPVMQKWLGYAGSYSESGLLQRWPDTDYRNWYLGDWAAPDGVDQTDQASVDLVCNCFMTICYETMQKIAEVTGKSSDAAYYAAKNETLKGLIHRSFYHPDQGGYGSGSQIDLTYPLLAGIVPDTLIGKVTRTLRDVIMNRYNGHIATGLVGIPVFTEWATENREADLMYSILKKKDYPGYLYMLENGATTTWEHWNGNRSRIHNCYNGIGSWFYQALGGIRGCDGSPGCRQLFIDPQVPGGITWVRAARETPYGTVSVKWEQADRNFHMELLVPAGSSARIAIPETVRIYKMNGKRSSNPTGYAEAGSGRHTFEWTDPVRLGL